MSCIFGIVQFNREPVSPNILQTILQTLDHWQADDTGIWCEGSMGMGHLMLYNTPESLQEKLPLYDNSSNLTITADARIDNRDELFTKLDIDFSVRKAMPDSTLILKAYEKYGKRCIEHLIGDFAFAIWDKKNQTLFCARDHMGVKPFFYYKDDNLFAFASEKKGILCLDNINKTIDRQFLYNQMILPLYQEIDTTLYENIRRIKPAHTLTLNAITSAIACHQYWTLDPLHVTTLATKKDYYEGLRYYFDQAIQCRIRSAYPIGAELSGGMDSSAITGAANKMLTNEGKKLVTFSNTVDDDTHTRNVYPNSERQYTDAVIEFNNIIDYEYITQTCWDTPLQEIDFCLFMNDGLERMEMLWSLPGKKIAMRRNIRTMLSGFAGDEMVTSRVKNYALDYLKQHKFIKYLLAPGKHDSDFDKFKALLPGSITNTWFALKNAAGKYGNSVKIASQFYNIPTTYQKNYSKILRSDPLFKERYKSLRHAQRLVLLSPIVSQRLECENRYGIYYNMESRFPMADIRLTQFYLSMPNEMKYEGNISRHAYRMAVQEYLPDIILQRDSKIGSNAPFLTGWREKRKKEVVQMLQHFPNTALIKPGAIPLKIKQLTSDGGDKKLDINELISLQTPSLNVLRWIEKNAILL